MGRQRRGACAWCDDRMYRQEFYTASGIALSSWSLLENKISRSNPKIRNRKIFGFGTLAQAAILCSFVIFVRIPKPNNFRFRNVGSGGHRLGEWCSGLTMMSSTRTLKPLLDLQGGDHIVACTRQPNMSEPSVQAGDSISKGENENRRMESEKPG